MQKDKSRIKDNIGRFAKSAIYVNKECIVCQNTFQIKESGLKYGRGKYCSRKCCDRHKKIICIGKGNGNFGKKISEKTRQLKSKAAKSMWNTPSIRANIKKGVDQFVLINGYWPGSDEKSKEKRKQTFMAKYGVPHNWMVKDIRKKCDITCLARYGKTPIQLMLDGLKSYSTKIEIITRDILNENNIKYQSQFQIWDHGNVRIYDFYIPSSNLLIEVDGDFWHGNPEKYSTKTLLDVQKENIRNDKYKNKIAQKHGYNLIRFWEHRVKLKNYSTELLQNIKQYENVTVKKKNQS